MNNFFKVLFVFILLGVSSQIFAQGDDAKGHQVGLAVGPTFPLTDLGGAKKTGAPFIRDIDFPATRFGLAAFYTYNFNEWVSVRGNLMWAMLHASDEYTDGAPPTINNDPDDSWFRVRRNLNFTTHIIEFQAMAQLNLKKYNSHIYKRGEKQRWAPYIGGGLGFFWFNPWTKYDGDKVKLQPLGTEGQGMAGYGSPYKKVALDLIGLVGIKFNVSKKVSLSVEAWYHQTFTDYIDDVSTNYIDPIDIPAYAQLHGEAAVNIQNRTSQGFYNSTIYNYVEGQYDQTTGELITNPTRIGEQRGDVADNDQFLHMQVTVAVNIGKTKMKNSTFGCGTRSKYKHKFSCPSW